MVWQEPGEKVWKLNQGLGQGTGSGVRDMRSVQALFPVNAEGSPSGGLSGDICATDWLVVLEKLSVQSSLPMTAWALA